MLEHLTLGEFVVSALMAGAALCAFVWGVASGAFRNVEGVKHDVLRVEGVTPSLEKPELWGPHLQ